MALSEKGHPPQSRAARLRAVDADPMPVTARAMNYRAGHVISRHSHAKSQLVYAVQGVMVVAATFGEWVVPPTLGIWMPAGIAHWIRCVGEVHMRSIYVHPSASMALPDACQTVGISPLLRELILATAQVKRHYVRDSREGRLTQLLLDELARSPSLPLHLPKPQHPSLTRICQTLMSNPDDDRTLGSWAGQFGVNAKTIQRMFVRETGMTFGKWRQQARLLISLEQLAGGAKVVDVALSLGYQSQSAFTALFKRQFGRTPGAFFGRAAAAAR